MNLSTDTRKHTNINVQTYTALHTHMHAHTHTHTHTHTHIHTALSCLRHSALSFFYMSCLRGRGPIHSIIMLRVHPFNVKIIRLQTANIVTSTHTHTHTHTRKHTRTRKHTQLMK